MDHSCFCLIVVQIYKQMLTGLTQIIRSISINQMRSMIKLIHQKLSLHEIISYFQFDQLQNRKMSKQVRKISQYIERRIFEVRQQSQKVTDKMERLKLAITQLSFAHLLSQYIGNNQYVFNGLINLSKAYINTQSYSDALIQARLAKKQAQVSPDNSAEKATILIAQCMIKQNKFEDALQTLGSLQNVGIQNNKEYYELLLNVLVQLGEEERVYEALINFQNSVKAKYGEKASEYGFFLVKKGKSLGKFGKYKQAIENLCQGIDILIQKKSKQKRQITEIYLTLADYYKKTENIQKQYSSLICAHAMAKQIDEPEKILMIVHLLTTNLIQREQYSKALSELKIARNLQKEMYGESSVQLGKTVKKMIQILNILNMKTEAKKYEHQYNRIVGLCAPILNLREKPLNCMKIAENY